MNMKEIRTQNAAELKKNLSALREQARDLLFKIHSREVKNSHTLAVVRKDIARILTLMKESK